MQWVKVSCVAGSVAQVIAVVHIQSLAWELPCATDVAIKLKKKKSCGGISRHSISVETIKEPMMGF